uniref:uncharacterized protein LOC130487480 n=1 Tax=Euleptes europaea TaxID=460621 RepID=UPI0025403740|nr:uncharacterized protein LOC130487480 [Euleptes europaea]
MANPRCTLHLLFLGLLIAPAFLQQHPCEIIKKTVSHGTFNLDVSPQTYRPGETYTITVGGIDNSTSVILQAVSADNRSGGLWEMESEAVSCSGAEYAVQKNVSGNATRIRWISPRNANVGAVYIRAFVTFANGTTMLQSHTFARNQTTGAMTPPPTATHTHRPTILHNATMLHHNWASTHDQTKGPYNSASTSQTTSVLLAAIQLLPIFLGFKLLS